MKKIFLLVLTVLALSACAEKNPLLKEWNTPFGIPPFEEVKPEHYVPAIMKAIEIHNAEIEAIANNPETPTFENTILALENAGQLLSKINGVFSGINSIASTDELAAISKELNPITSKHSSEVSLNEGIFQRIKYLYDHKDELNMDELQWRVVEKRYKSMTKNGSELPADKKAELQQLNAEISALQLNFSQNLLKETAAWTLVIDNEKDLSGLSEDFIADAAARAKKAGLEGKWVIGLDNPSFIPFMTNADNRDLRIKVLDAFSNRCNNNNEQDNKEIIKKIVKLRDQKAKLLGYDGYVSFKLEDRMAANADNVYALLDQVWNASKGVTLDELKDIDALAREDGITHTTAADWRYYQEKARAKNFNLNNEELRPYFKYENVRDGVFYVANRLFGLTVTPLENVPLPHPDVDAFQVKDADGTHLAVLFLDMFARPGEKRSGAWCGGYNRSTYVDGKRVPGIVSICGNFTRPVGDKPALLDVDEVETLFHEFGHALASFMLDVPYAGLGGFDHDFSELPSQINEHWAFQPEVLNVYAKHYQTGETIPMELVEKYIASSNYGTGFAMTERVAAMYMDMDLYSIAGDIPENFDLLAFEYKTMKDRGLVDQILPRYRYPYFQHIFSSGYDVGYYSYLWAEVLDCDAFKAFEESGDIFNQELARKYRYEILARGGEVDAMELYLNFRGHEPTPDALLEYNGIKK
ncbi:MAG: M3 family metallopeptidase [Bacteroidales bacterium]|nr:M3 family metallopeptidase [Bacteroidales bacterium]